MNLPWVSRAVLEAERERHRSDMLEAARRYDDGIQFLQNRNAEWGARYDALLEKFTALRVAGAVPEPKPAILAELPVQQHDPLKALIHELAGTDYRKRAIMLRQLTADRAQSVEEDEIKRRIVAGVQSEGVPA